jgi:peptide/nickel transport system permease protein
MNWGWLWRRLVALGIVLVLVSIATFLLVEALPGDPASAILGQSATPESIAIVRQDLHLDDPLPVRYVRWGSRALQGDLGVSYRTGEVITAALRTRLGTSLELLVLTQLAALALAVPPVLASARRERGRADRFFSNGAFFAVAMPQFALGIALLVIFAQKLGWFPVSQYVPLGEGVTKNLHAMVLPVATLCVPLAGIYYRVLRTDLMQTMRSDHINFARAMGLSKRRVLLGRSLRPSSLTLISVMGLNTAFLLGGAAIVERLFSLPGLGAFTTDAILTQDVVKVQGATLLVAVVYVVTNLVVDILLTVLDPRVRLSRSAS